MKRKTIRTLAGFILACLVALVVGIIAARNAAAPAPEQSHEALEIKPPVEETIPVLEQAVPVRAVIEPPLQVTVKLENARVSTAFEDVPAAESTAEQVKPEVETDAGPEAPEPSEPEPQPDPEQVELLACAIYQEAGSDYIADETRYMVGDVILNRVADSRFPDTLAEVLTQQGQYGRFSWTGVCWPERASYPGEAAAVQRAHDTAEALLSGTHSELYGQGYVWQAEFTQGTDVIYADGLYFGR